MVEDAAAVREFTRALADDLVRAAPGAVVGVYLHGSAVLGDWRAAASDVDVLVIVRDDPANDIVARLTAALLADRPGPGGALEASIVEAFAAALPGEPWPFVVHVNRGVDDRTVVSGGSCPGDADLVLHYAVTRASGWAAAGPSPRSVVGAIPDVVVRRQLVTELRWALDHGSESYAVLNACRALRFDAEGVLCSKSDGGEWAVARGIEAEIVRRALAARRAGAVTAIAPDAADWVAAVAGALAE